MHQTVSADEWRTARNELLKEEKAATQLLGELAAKRRQLPMVKVENPNDIHFTSADGKQKSLLDLFEGRQQLILYEFMLTDKDKEGCVGCSLVMDHIGPLGHLQSRDTSFAAAAAASIEKVTAFKERMGWDLPFYSSKETFTDGKDSTWKPVEGGFGLAVFLREGQDVFHTYSTGNRGVESILSTYSLLDMTRLGRQENGNGITKFRLHDKY